MSYFSNTVRSGWLNLVSQIPDLNEAGTHPYPYIADLQDEQRWETAFNRTQSALVAAARQATTMDIYNQL